MAKKQYRVRNWKEYNNALKQRGSLTVWIEKDFEKTWFALAEKVKKRGRALIYSDSCIKLIMSVRHIYKLALRQVEGFVSSLFDLLKIELPVPNFIRLSRRMKGALSHIKYPSLKEKIHLVLDSSGLKIFGEKEWIKTKKGKTYERRVWRKIHIGINGEGHILASQMTDHKTNDRKCFDSLIEEAGHDIIEEALADSGYDSLNNYRECKKKNIIPLIPPPKNAKVHLEEEELEQRNKTIEYIKEKGLYAWKAKNNFGRRNRVENTFFRIKTIFGRSLLSRKWENQEKETRLICALLNQMTSLGMPQSVKI